MTHDEFILLKTIEDFRSMADPERAKHSQRYFKTGPGEYAEGDVFMGLSVPDIRFYEKQYRPWSLGVLEQLLQRQEHDLRLLALFALAQQSERSKDNAVKQAILDLYLRNTQYVNNWDLVDSSAPRIVGYYVATWPADKRACLLDRLAKSDSLWEQRIAMVANWGLIRKGIYDDTLRVGEILLHHKHDLIHKALGWMLRELGKKDSARFYAFIDAHAHSMPRTALRYAIEKLEPEERKLYLSLKAAK